MQLRERQKLLVERVVAALRSRGNTLAVGPTGSGKTVMLSAATAEVIRETKGNAIVLQHRTELVEQNRRTFGRVAPELSTGEFTANRKEWGYRVTFGMIDTLRRASNLATMPPLDLMVIDEGHHAAADGYIRTIDAARKTNPDMKLLLVTATPNRGDKRALRGIVDNVADQITLKELIESGHLVRPRTFVIDLGVQNELRSVKRTVSDFDMDAVAAIMDHTPLNDAIVAAWKEKAGDRQTVVFCSTVEHARHVMEAFQAGGVSAAIIHGEMPPAERRDILARYDRGEIQVITNVAVLTEGWDHQPTSCVILLRPSSYKSTMIQMIGRGLRKVDPERYPGVTKDDCIVLDFGTSILEHGGIEQDVNIDQEGTKSCPSCEAMLPTQCPDCPICGYVFPKEDPEMKNCDACGAENFLNARVCVECGEPFGEGSEKTVLDKFILTEVDLLRDSPYRWEKIQGDLVTMAFGGAAWAACVPYYGRWHVVGGSKETGVRHIADNDDKLLAITAADDFLRENGDRDFASKGKRWLNEPATDKQMGFLGVDKMAAFGLTKYRACCLLEWKWNERGIRKKLEATRARLAA